MELGFVPVDGSDRGVDQPALGVGGSERVAAVGAINLFGSVGSSGEGLLDEFGRDGLAELAGDLFDGVEGGAVGGAIGSVEFLGQMFGNFLDEVIELGNGVGFVRMCHLQTPYGLRSNVLMNFTHESTRVPAPLANRVMHPSLSSLSLDPCKRRRGSLQYRRFDQCVRSSIG